MEFMQRALDLAERAAGGLAPRPAVGAVIVARDGETIVGEGATQPNPGPHAEAVALDIAQSRAQDAANDGIKGGTIFCTLEPHQNRSTTPPCTQALIDAGIRTVVCPTVDPNPLVAGRGFEHLKSAGIQIINDVDETSQLRANELIEGFAKHINTGLPFVTVKWAMSLDGKIATRDGDSRWITSPAARAHAHSLRYRADAVMTGIGTVLADNPRLTARDPVSGKRMCGRPYIRVVVDSNAKMPAGAAILEEEGEVIHAVANNNAPNRRCNVLRAPSKTDDAVDLSDVVRQLGERGCINVLVEAGERLTGGLFDRDLVDKVVVYISTTKIIGGSNALSPVGGCGPSVMRDVSRLRNTRIERFDDDIAIIGYVE